MCCAAAKEQDMIDNTYTTKQIRKYVVHNVCYAVEAIAAETSNDVATLTQGGKPDSLWAIVPAGLPDIDLWVHSLPGKEWCVMLQNAGGHIVNCRGTVLMSCVDTVYRYVGYADLEVS